MADDPAGLLRDLAPGVLGALARRAGDFAAAEDAVQEALVAAAAQWPAAGVPDHPRGWLYQVAARRFTDHRRGERARRLREEAVSAALAGGAVGPYRLQAAIAAVHDEAARAEETDWPQILALYGLLARTSDNPMVALNEAVAAAMVHGPAVGLARAAAGRTASGPERDYLLLKAARVTAG